MTTTYSVPGISCDHCKHTIESATMQVPGVSSAVVDVAHRTVVVQGAAPQADVRSAIEAAGYDVETVVEA